MIKRVATTAIAILAVLGPGCAGQNDASVNTWYVCAPAEDATKCAPDGGVCERYLTGNAWVYTTVSGVTNDMGFFMEIHNNRPANGDESAGTLNTADALITSYTMTYELEGATVAIPGVTVRDINVPIPAAGSATPWVTLIPASAMTAISAAMTASPQIVHINVRVAGRYRDGYPFETGDFSVAAAVINADFNPATYYTCVTAGDVVVAICPGVGQTSSWACESP